MRRTANDVRTGDSHALIDVKSGQKINPAKNVNIVDHDWVAAHSLMLQGVSIGENSVAAKSCTEQGVVLAGNPAKITRRGITWTEKRFIDK